MKPMTMKKRRGVVGSLLKLLFQISLVVSLCSLTATRGCPTPCICKWKGGKQTVECGGHKLLSLPEGMDPGTQVLNFTYNALTSLQHERFQSMELTNLQKIYLSHNELLRIHDRAFRGLSNLVELDLSYNALTAIPTETFQDYSSLMRLSLSNNPIRELKASAFKYLSYLTTLDLNDCQISAIEDGTFLGMDNLEWLRLDNNQIRTIRGAKILPETLNGIALQGNRWLCDCKLIDMFSWLKAYNIPQTEEPKCAEPRKHHGAVIKSLQIDELACLPDISPTTIYLEIAEGRNITLTCKITAVPEASISWWFQGQVLQNDTVIAPNLHLYYYVEEGERDEKRSELFIYNANADDNGTFACVAENAAGRTQANYTVRVIVKEEPIVEEVLPFPPEIFLAVTIGGAVLALTLVICCCAIMCNCRKRQRRRAVNDQDGKSSGSSSSKQSKKKGKQRKEVSFQLPSSQKCVAITNDMNNSLVCAKMNGNLTITDNNQQEMLLYLGNAVAPNMGLSDHLQSHCGSPHQDIRNPDLINDAESLRQRNEKQQQYQHLDNSDLEEQQRHLTAVNSSEMQNSVVQRMMPPSRFMSSLPRNINMRDMYQVDVHLNPGCFVDANGYPIEYIPIINQSQLNYNSANGFATLPHNRNKSSSQASAGPLVRLSNEAEFITRTSQTFQTYNSPDVRYTAEGYPCIVDPQQLVNSSLDTQQQNFPSPPEGYKSSDSPSTISIVNSQNFLQHHPQQFNSSSASQSSAAASAVVPKWPSCLPAPGGYSTPPHSSYNTAAAEPTMTAPTTTKNVRFQLTPLQEAAGDLCENNVIHEEEEEEEDDDEDDSERRRRNGSGSNDETGNHTKCRQLKGRPLADSPDEGYVGDSQESSDM